MLTIILGTFIALYGFMNTYFFIKSKSIFSRKTSGFQRGLTVVTSIIMPILLGVACIILGIACIILLE